MKVSVQNYPYRTLEKGLSQFSQNKIEERIENKIINWRLFTAQCYNVQSL